MPILSLGGKGVISVTSNLMPKEKHDEVALFNAGKQAEALEMIDDSGFDDVLAFSLKSERYVKAQFLFPDMHVRLASTLKKLKSQSARPDFIIADREDNLQLWSGALWHVGDVNNNIHLYACTNAAREWCEAQGLELSAPASFEYSGRNIPSTSSVTRDGGAAVLPEGSAVYKIGRASCRERVFRAV